MRTVTGPDRPALKQRMLTEPSLDGHATVEGTHKRTRTNI